MNVTGTFKDPLTRQLSEAQLIQTTPHVMNSKSEWGTYHIPRAGVIVTNIDNTQQQGTGAEDPSSQ